MPKQPPTAHDLADLVDWIATYVFQGDETAEVKTQFALAMRDYVRREIDLALSPGKKRVGGE